MRTGRILGFIVGGVFAVIAVGLLSVWLFVNPNHYKDKIAAAVKNATGRDLILQGDIKLSVFPWIALELGPASLGNPGGFTDQPFVSFRHAAVRAMLLPLLHERLDIARVEIDGLDLRLLKNIAGKGNWEGFGDSTAQDSSQKSPPGAGSRVQVPALKLTNARVSYEKFALENINLETAPFADGVIPIALRFDANRGVAGEVATVDAKVDFSNPAAKLYRLAAFTLMGQVSQAGNSRSIRWNVSMPSVDLDLEAQTLAAPNLAMIFAGAQLNGSVTGTQIVDAPNLAGTLTLAPLVVREFLPRLGLSSPQTRDPRALSLVSVSAAFVYGGNVLRVDKVQLALDDTHVGGDVAENLATKALTFHVSADQIDVDRYLAPEGHTPAAPAPKSSKPSSPLDAEGTLAVGALQAAGLALTNLQVTLLAKSGVTHLFPLQAQLYGGRYSGDITLDGRGGAPLISVDEHLTGIDMAKLLVSKNKSIHLSGKGNVSVKASGHGAGADAILKTLNGHTDAYLTQGAVEGVDLGYELGRAEALIKRETAPSVQNTNVTKFDALKLTAQITNGIAVTKDLAISSQVLRVTGQGSANLATQGIDFQLLADTLRTTQGIPIQVPVKVTGTVSDPTIRPDLEALATGQLRQKLQDVLQDKLKGLFGKP